MFVFQHLRMSFNIYDMKHVVHERYESLTKSRGSMRSHCTRIHFHKRFFPYSWYWWWCIRYVLCPYKIAAHTYNQSPHNITKHYLHIPTCIFCTVHALHIALWFTVDNNNMNSNTKQQQHRFLFLVSTFLRYTFFILTFKKNIKKIPKILMCLETRWLYQDARSAWS